MNVRFNYESEDFARPSSRYRVWTRQRPAQQRWWGVSVLVLFVFGLFVVIAMSAFLSRVAGKLWLCFGVVPGVLILFFFIAELVKPRQTDIRWAMARQWEAELLPSGL